MTPFVKLSAAELNKLKKDELLKYTLKLHEHNDFLENQVLAIIKESNKAIEKT